MTTKLSPLPLNDLLCARCVENIEAYFSDIRFSLNMPPQQREVEWYKHFGRYPERIATSGSGAKFVIGDWSWNRQHPGKAETIEPVMRCAKVYSA